MGARRQSYALLLGVVVGMLVAGLVVPLGFGEVVGSRRGEKQGVAATPNSASRGDVGRGSPSTLVPSAVTEGGAEPRGVTLDQPSARPGGAAGGAAAGDAASANAGTALTASDRGVTPTGIKVGFILIDLASAAQIGFVVGLDPDEQQQMWQSFVDDVNSRGGIHGRTIEPVYRKVDPIDSSTATAACLAFTDDAKVFAVAGRFVDVAASQCVVQRKQTPLVENNSHPDELYGTGLLVTMFPTTSRVVSNFAAELGRMKLLTGRNVGILSDEGTDPGGAGAATFEREVKKSKPRDVHAARLSDNLTTGSSQIPVIVNRMRTAGVDTVLFIANPIYATQFVSEAESQRWFPAYAASDFASMANTDSGVANMPDSFDGALGITSQRLNEHLVGISPPAPAIECRRIVAERWSGEPIEEGSAEDTSLLTMCDQFRVLVAGATAAGPTLTRPAWSEATQALGPLEGAKTAGGSFRPGKFDFADLLRPERWRADCECWRPDGDFRDPVYA